jgi:AraC family transcriptional regulator
LQVIEATFGLPVMYEGYFTGQTGYGTCTEASFKFLPETASIPEAAVTPRCITICRMTKLPTPVTSILDGYPEPSLLSKDQLARWKGLRIGYFNATGLVRGYTWVDHPCIGLISSGAAQGSLRFGLNNTELDVGAGTAGLFGPHMEFNRCKWQSNEATRILVELDRSTYRRLGLEDVFLGDYLQQNLEFNDSTMNGLLLGMIEEIRQGCPHGELFAESLSHGLIRYVHLHHGSSRQSTAAFEGKSRFSAQQFSRLEEYVRANRSDKITMQNLADAVGVSQAVLFRRFRNTFACSPYQYVLSERIAAAKRMLAFSEVPLVEIALMTGFSSHSHFSMAFSRGTGLSPTEFALNCRA